jgi:hypothetical protein
MKLLSHRNGSFVGLLIAVAAGGVLASGWAVAEFRFPMPEFESGYTHPPVITLGRNGTWQNLVVPEEMLQARGVTRFHSDRGGDITFHGPGQLVGYPLLKLEGREQDVVLIHSHHICPFAGKHPYHTERDVLDSNFFATGDAPWNSSRTRVCPSRHT